MAKKKDLLKEWMTWGCENENNRKEAIEAACFVIATLNSRSSDKKLSQQELDQLCGGAMTVWDDFHESLGGLKS